ncbi:hypothetical protein MRB53_014952 [Persea americana]|uniref:Uncharacterized protein n=1 Tax=Persea americana TaxID=3435 RepID=A0ACC2KCG1_PERAE|nr:hypothetical protein MRB53_014952 [Persea americana]
MGSQASSPFGLSGLAVERGRDEGIGEESLGSGKMETSVSLGVEMGLGGIEASSQAIVLPSCEERESRRKRRDLLR